MNPLFINSIISEISTLRKDSVHHINEEIKKARKDIKENKLLLEYGDLLDKVVETGKPSSKKINRFLNKKFKNGKVSDYIEFEKTNNNEYKIKLKTDHHYFDPKNVIIIRNNIIQKLDIAEKNAIINLITLYEKFLRQLIYYDCKDDYYKIIENEQINLSQLLKMNFNKDEIIEHIQEQYCNDKLRGENKRISKIISILGIDCKDELDLLSEFDEIYFRRNMYVHSIPCLTDDYKSLPESIRKKWVNNDGELINGEEYFYNAFCVTTKIVMLLIIKYCLFKKQSKDDLETITELVYDKFYNNRNTEIALFCYKQLKKLNWISPLDRYTYFVNYMICLKRLNHPDFKQELDKWKPDTDADMFRLAKKLVANDYTNINLLIKKLLNNKDNIENQNYEEQFTTLTIDQINDWPLFEEYVQTEHYAELLKSIE